jgi:hypothetical protein
VQRSDGFAGGLKHPVEGTGAFEGLREVDFGEEVRELVRVRGALDKGLGSFSDEFICR